MVTWAEAFPTLHPSPTGKSPVERACRHLRSAMAWIFFPEGVWFANDEIDPEKIDAAIELLTAISVEATKIAMDLAFRRPRDGQ